MTRPIRLSARVGSTGRKGEPKANFRRTKAVESPSPTVLAFAAQQPGWGYMRKRHAHFSDEALVALVARGDEDALGELYDRVGRIAFGDRKSVV